MTLLNEDRPATALPIRRVLPHGRYILLKKHIITALFELRGRVDAEIKVPKVLDGAEGVGLP